MKNTHLLLSLFCALFLFAGCIKVQKEYYPNGKLKSETHYRFGKETGTTTYYHDHYPTKIMEIEMKRGKRNGKFIQRYFDGSVETTATYKNDLLEGVETRHYHTAGPSMQVEYSKGIKHGRVTAWFIDGTIRETGTYVNDMPDGEWLNYDNRGMMIGEGLFDRGTGKLFIYDDKGRLQSETNYVNNKKEGLETHYLSSGEIEKTILFKEDRIVEINGISIENL